MFTSHIFLNFFSVDDFWTEILEETDYFSNLFIIVPQTQMLEHRKKNRTAEVLLRWMTCPWVPIFLIFWGILKSSEHDVK